MILLEKGNRILQETVAAVLLRDMDEKPTVSPCDVKLCDFDDVLYKVTITPEDTSKMTVSMNCPVMTTIGDMGGNDAVSRVFGDMVSEPETGFDVTITVPTEAKNAEELVEKITTMKSTAVGGGFDYYLSALKDGSTRENGKFDLRGDTTVYVKPGKDRCTFVFAIDFMEDVDKCVAKVFMQELQNSNRNNRSAPPCAWSVDPPNEVKEFGITENEGVLGYISFAVLPRHVEKNKEDVIHVLQTFRSFLQYHIKMSKSYWHSKMRARTSSLLKVLNRAKVEDPNAASKKKTASGKTFRK